MVQRADIEKSHVHEFSEGSLKVLHPINSTLADITSLRPLMPHLNFNEACVGAWSMGRQRATQNPSFYTRLEHTTDAYELFTAAYHNPNTGSNKEVPRTRSIDDLVNPYSFLNLLRNENSREDTVNPYDNRPGSMRSRLRKAPIDHDTITNIKKQLRKPVGNNHIPDHVQDSDGNIDIDEYETVIANRLGRYFETKAPNSPEETVRTANDQYELDL